MWPAICLSCAPRAVQPRLAPDCLHACMHGRPTVWRSHGCIKQGPCMLPLCPSCSACEALQGAGQPSGTHSSYHSLLQLSSMGAQLRRPAATSRICSKLQAHVFRKWSFCMISGARQGALTCTHRALHAEDGVALFSAPSPTTVARNTSVERTRQPLRDQLMPDTSCTRGAPGAYRQHLHIGNAI